MPRSTLLAVLAGLCAVALVATAAAVAGAEKKGKPALSSTPVFKLHLKPSQEVPRIQGLKAKAVGHVTLDLERSSAGAITAGEVVFYFNYSFPASVTVTGLHVHRAAKGVNGPIVVDSGLTTFTDADGRGNVTRVVSGVAPATLQAILDNARGHYVNLHTSTHPDGAVRAQMHNPKKS
jgi:CHRD domain